MTQVRIPMSSPDITAVEIEAVNQVLQTRYLSLGPPIAEFMVRMWFVMGAGSVVTKDVPARTKAAGMPARVIRRSEVGQLES